MQTICTQCRRCSPYRSFLLGILALAYTTGCGGGGGGAGGSLPASGPSEPRAAVLSSSAAIDIPLRIVLAKGPGGANAGEADEIMARATATLERQLSVRFSVASFEELADPTPELRDPAAQENLLVAWQAWAEDNKLGARDAITVVLIPPYHVHGEYRFGGIASVECAFNRGESVAVVAVGPKTADTAEDRIEKSAMSVAHELAHILGAGHSDDESLMAPVLNFAITPELGLNSRSVAEVARCLG